MRDEGLRIGRLLHHLDHLHEKVLRAVLAVDVVTGVLVGETATGEKQLHLSEWMVHAAWTTGHSVVAVCVVHGFFSVEATLSVVRKSSSGYFMRRSWMNVTLIPPLKIPASRALSSST